MEKEKANNKENPQTGLLAYSTLVSENKNRERLVKPMSNPKYCPNM